MHMGTGQIYEGKELDKALADPAVKPHLMPLTDEQAHKLGLVTMGERVAWAADEKRKARNKRKAARKAWRQNRR
jgi:hypothetical protein